MTTRIRTEHSNVPVIVNRFDAGLITNRDPLHVPTNDTGHSTYVSGDALIDGLNTEITNNNRLGRRPGFTVYSPDAIASGTPLSFAQFKTDSVVRLLDTTTDVYVFASSEILVSGTSVLSIYTKGTTAPSRFQQVGNHLYWVDGTNARRFVTAMDGFATAKWGIDAPSNAASVSLTPLTGLVTWAANTFYNPSLLLIDSNSNLQKLTTSGTTGSSEPTWSTTPGGTTTDGTAVWTLQGTSVRATSHAYSVGDYIRVAYSVSITVQQWVQEVQVYVPVTYVTNYDDTFKCTTAGTSSSTATGSLTWNPGIGSTVTDGTVTWTNTGTTISWSTIGATTLVSTNTTINDSNGNAQNIYLAGKSGGTEPTWKTATGALTADGAGMSWICAGPLAPQNTGSWKYVYVYRQSTWNFGEDWYHISATSPESLPIILTSGNAVSVTGDFSSPGYDVDVYRTKQGGSVYYFAGTATGTTSQWSFIDTIPDELLDTSKTVSTVPLNLPPPAGSSLVAFWQGRVWLASGSNLYFDGGGDITNGDPHQSFPLANVFPFSGIITALTSTSEGLIVWIGDEAHVILGGPQTLTFFEQPLFNRTGVRSQNAVIADRDRVFCYTGQSQALTFSPDEFGEFGYNVADLLQTYFNPSSTYLVSHRDGPDVGIFMSDGTDNILRFNPTTSTWSPIATIAAGCGPLASLELEDGTFALLTTIGGYICKRNLSVFTDGHAAATYTAYGTVGSLEVAAMSEPTKALRHVFVRSTDQGTRPSVGMLQNSKSGTFSDVTYVCSVPAKLDGTPLQVSDTRQERFDIQQSELIALDQFNHFQIKFSWPAENAKNEISAFSVGDTAR